ncbi:CBU_0592 family membrane protein [Thalassotalea litorea]|uniref:CBU_0592 family membrane protein n=1 Tax=Thalassotalea litorea TaxID=2020715 RepID=UPI003736C035
MSISLFADIIGMLGTASVVLAFFLIQLERINPKGLQYNLLNLVGAILLLISLSINFNLASFVIEIFWIMASLVGIFKYHQRRRLIVAEQ